MITDNLRPIKKALQGHKAQLIAVSKTQPEDKIEKALSCGLRIFGENRVQEAQDHWAHRRASYPDLELHLIGPLQTNKVKTATELFDVIHTLDREKLAKEIIKHRPDMPCFIQVNTGEEEQKAGISPFEVTEFTKYCRNDLGMSIIGLMCIPPVAAPSGLHFGLLADLAQQLDLKNLSMGMSDDYPLALQYGATHIRVGSKLFGERS